MTIDQMVQRYSARDTEVGEGENIEDLGGYGLLRGVRDRCLSIELRKKDDCVLAIPYTVIEQFVYTPADGITLRAAGREIRIKGQNLNENTARPLTLFSAITRQRVLWIVEQSRSSLAPAKESTIIESISW